MSHLHWNILTIEEKIVVNFYRNKLAIKEIMFNLYRNRLACFDFL